MTPRAALIFAILTIACNRSGVADNNRPATSPAPVSVPAPAPVPAEDAAAPLIEAEEALLSVDTPALVGRLVVNEPYSWTQPSEYCLDDGHVYAGAPARIGELPVFVGADVRSLRGKTVLARGVHAPSLLAELRKQGPCPADYGGNPAEMPQMRSDWVSPEGGFKTTREKLAKLACFRASSLRAVELGKELSKDADRVVVELVNPFAASLSSLEGFAHYEGGPGKPMPRLEKLQLELPPGKTQRLELAARVEAGPAGQTSGRPRGIYRLHTVELKGRVGKVDFDVTIMAHVRK